MEEGQTLQWSKEKDRHYNGQKKRTDTTMVKIQRTTMIYETLHRKLNTNIKNEHTQNK
jgi:hypothetical protein